MSTFNIPVLRWCIFICVIKLSKSQYMPLLLSTYSNNDVVSTRCLLDKDHHNKALSIFSEKYEAFKDLKSYYIPNHDSSIFNCNFEGNRCDYSVNNFRLSDTVSLFNFPIYDERWQGFEEIVSHDEFQYTGIKTETGFSFSVRGNDNLHLAICDEKHIDYYTTCYWFMIDKSYTGYRKYSGLTKCRRNMPRKGESSDCEEFSPKQYTNVVEKNIWNTFRIYLSKYDKKTSYFLIKNEIKILEYDETSDRVKVQYVFVKSNQPAVWKFHKTKFVITTTIGDILYSSTLKNPGSQLCIAFYTYMCLSCNIYVFLNYIKNDRAVVISTIDQGTKKYEWVYNKISFNLNDDRSEGVYISFETRCNNIIQSIYWVIDDIRECSIEETRIVELTSEKGDDYYCQAINEEHVIKKEIPENSYNCPNGLLGNDCSLNCRDIVKTDFCNNTVLCTKDNCFCPLGFYGNTCEKECTDVHRHSKFCQYNCNDNCDSAVDCNFFNGHCKKCKFGYQIPKCERLIYSILATQLEILDVGHDFAKIHIKFSPEEDTDEVSYYSIQYKEWSDYNPKWIEETKPTIFKFGEDEIITINSLLSQSSYGIRAIFYDLYNRSNTDETLHYINITTKCEELEFDKINDYEESGAITIDIYFKRNMFTCNIKTYELYVDGTQISFTNDSFAYKKYLTPYSNIIINLKNVYTNTNIFIHYMTQETPSSRITNLIHNETDREIYLKWDAPEYPNGKILYYLVRYEIIRLKGCPNHVSLDDTGNYSTEFPVYTLKNLRPFTIYKVYITPISTKVGVETSQEIHTLETDTVTEQLQEHSNSVETFNYDLSYNRNHTFAIIRWNLPSDCKTIQGNIQYRIHLLGASKFDSREKTVDINNSDIVAYKFEHLFPFINYTAFLYTKRPGKEPNDTPALKYNFRTMPANPPQVSMFEAYGQSNKKIFLKWKKPSPPYGVLEKYELTHDCGPLCRLYKFTVPANSSCEAWEEYTCYTLKNLAEGYRYKLSIRAKNVDTNYGPESTIYVYTQFEKPSEPENASVYFNAENSSLIVKWHHPFYNSPVNEFRCMLCIHDQPENCLKDIKKIDKIEKEYSSMFTGVKHATTYKVHLQAINDKYDGIENTFIIDTNPPIPKFNMYPTFKNIINSTINVFVPASSPNYKYDNTTLLITISMIENKDEIEISNTSSDLLQLKSPWNGFYFTIGNETANISLATSVDLIRSLNVSFNLTSYYKNEISYKDYFISKSDINSWSKTTFEEPQEKSNSGLYALLIFLFIIPVIIVLLRKRTSLMQKTEDIALMTKPQLSQSSRLTQKDKSSSLETPENKSNVLTVSTTTNRKSSQNEVLPSDSTTRVKITNLKDYVKTAMETNIFEQQHKSFPKGQTKQWDSGFIPENKNKNRYGNIIAYDETRVVLKKLPEDPFSDYINANYVDGYQTKKAYIATQGPKEKTVNDFWRMVWQEESKYIVMLCNVMENGKKKCEQYWPSINETKEYGTIKVYHMNSQVYATYISRSFKVTNEAKSRTILQFHFTSWPDHGIPLYAKSLMPLLKRIVVLRLGPPIIIHCSAGVGRTGTILLCDICLRMAAGEGAVDVYKHLGYLRKQRINMIDNTDQYLLVHLLLVECLLVEQTNILCDDQLEDQINNIISLNSIQKQMDMIDEFAWMDKVVRPNTKLNPIHHSKNRFEDIIAGYGRVMISTYPLDNQFSDYINAVFVNGYAQKDQFIVTQQPLPKTLSDFWRMIDEKGICVIVSLNVLDFDDETLIPFYPDDKFELKPVPYLAIRFINNVETKFYDLITISLINTSSEEHSQRTINIIQFKSWTADNILPSGDIINFIHLWEKMEKISKENSPTVVTCYNGVTASGLFVTLSFLIEKIKLEQECDVCLAVRSVRHNRQEFIRDMKQFEFLYKAAMIYVQSFQFYSNFQVCLRK